MADATILPTSTESKFFYWANKPKLTVGLSNSASDTTLYWSAAPTDSTGATITGGFISSWTNKAGKTERIWVPANAVAADGLSATGCVRGIDPNGLDYTVGDTNFILELDGGSTGNCVIAAQSVELIRAALQNLIATGATGFTIGVNAGGTVTIYRATGAGTKQGFLRWNTGNSKAEYSNDGTTWNSIDSVSASNLLVVTNSDTTPSNLNAKTSSGTGITRTVLNPGANELLQFSVNGNLSSLISDVTATATEINQALHVISANVTAANLGILTAGNSSNADALHTHSVSTIAATAGEAINGATTPQAIAILGNNYRRGILINATGNNVFYRSGTFRKIGDADATTREAQSIVFTDALATTIKLETWTSPIEKTGAPSDNLYMEIQTDSAGSPSGTVVTNGTSDVIAGGSLSTTMLPVKFTWSTPPTLTSGTTYWGVFRRSGANDAANYYATQDAGASTYANGTAKSYTASTTSWADLSKDIQSMVVLICDYDGKVVLADSNDMLRSKVSGFTRSNVSAGQSITCVTNGYQNSFSGLSEGSVQFLSTTAGGVTTSPSISTTFNSVTVLAEIGETSSASTITLKPKYEHIIGGITGLGGTSLIEAGVSGTATLDLLIETGFCPRVFEISYKIDNSGGTTTSDLVVMTKFIKTTCVSAFILTSDNYTPSTATSAVTTQTSAESHVSIAAVYENAYLLRITMTTNNEDISALSIRATA